jgi:hypothetical protein
MTTASITACRALEPSPDLYGHHVPPVPAGCVILPTEDLAVGDVLQHDLGTVDLVTSIAATAGTDLAQVHVLRTVRSGRTTTCSFWIGAHARRSVHLVRRTPTGPR